MRYIFIHSNYLGTNGLNNNFTGFFPIANFKSANFNELFSKKEKVVLNYFFFL